MKAAIVGFGSGAGWILAGWRLFRAAPLHWILLVIGYWVLMTLLGQVPLVGAPAAVALIPAFSVGFMAVGRSCARGTPPALGELFAGFREAVPAQLALGALYVACLAAILWATAQADGGALARWMLSGRRPADEVLVSDGFLAALAIAAGAYLPVMMLYWFAPVLVAWHGMGVAKSLFFSFAACAMNWRAFTGYSVMAAVITMVIPFVALTVILVLAGAPARNAVVGLMLPLLLLMLPVLYGSFYASYRDIFGSPATAPGGDAAVG